MHLSGGPADYFWAFLGGVGLSFTPCVYPLVPVSVGYIGSRTQKGRLSGLALSLVYVTGVAVTYSLLGLLASLTGTFFGRFSTHPLTYILVGLVVILFGVSMLDLVRLPLPSIVKLPTLKRHNYFSTFVFGLASGLVISPCLTPVLGTILAYLTTKKNLLYGATLLFSFAYGMGLILVLAGTFSSILANLPKSGKWMEYIKRVYAFLLIFMGMYFIVNAIRRI